MKKILLLFGTHGNEAHLSRSLEYIDNWHSLFDVLIVNEEAVTKCVRYLNYDMNRTAPGDYNSKYYELYRGAQIQDITKKYAGVIDVHGTLSECGITCIITKKKSQNLTFAGYLPEGVPIIIREGNNQSQGPITQFIYPSFEIECGSMDKVQTIIDLANTIMGWAQQYNKQINNSKRIIYQVCGAVERGSKLDPTITLEWQEIQYEGRSCYAYLTKTQYLRNRCYIIEKTSL